MFGSLFAAAQTIRKNFIPAALSFGTAFSTAGQSLFGTARIFDWIYGYTFASEETVPDWANQVREIAYVAVIAANVIIIVDTRFPAIFREYFKKSAKATLKEIHERDELDNDIERIYESESDYFLPINAEPDDNVYIVKIIHHIPVGTNSLNAAPIPIEIKKLKTIPEKQLIAAKEEQESKSLAYHFAKSGIANTLKFLGLCSISFASINTFLGSITLFEYMGINHPAIKFTGSAYTVACKFYSSYSYVFPATKKSADKLSRWIMGERDPLADPNTPLDRMADVKNYMGTIGLSFLNIVSSPFLAYFSTEQTLYKIPFIGDYDTFVDYFSAASTFSSFTNDIISKSPSVHKAFLAWRHRKEDGSEEIRALEEAKLLPLQLLNGTIVVAGINDSLATGANLVVSVINTSNKVFYIDKYNAGLFVFSTACGLSASLVNYAFSVRRGHRDFLKHEIYPYLARRGYLAHVESKNPLPDIKQTEVLKIMPKHAETPASTANTNGVRPLFDSKDSLREGLLSESQKQNGIRQPPSSPQSPFIFARHALFSKKSKKIIDITPTNPSNAFTLS